MRNIIENPASTMDEAIKRVHDEVLPELPADSHRTASEFGEVYFKAGATWSAALIKQEMCRPGDRRASSQAAEKIIAQACATVVHGPSN